MTTPLPFCLVGVIIGEMENRGGEEWEENCVFSCLVERKK